MADDTGLGAPIAPTELRTFLIADVRGYGGLITDPEAELRAHLARQ